MAEDQDQLQQTENMYTVIHTGSPDRHLNITQHEIELGSTNDKTVDILYKVFVLFLLYHKQVHHTQHTSFLPQSPYSLIRYAICWKLTVCSSTQDNLSHITLTHTHLPHTIQTYPLSKDHYLLINTHITHRMHTCLYRSHTDTEIVHTNEKLQFLKQSLHSTIYQSSPHHIKILF